VNGPEKHQEIIIIRRGGDEEEGHHGGAWKIAFADFMTAMMALFLVLWLINAANEETKKAVASYFNPVKLVERNRSVKGLHDAEGVQETEVTAPNEMFPEESAATPVADQETKSDTQFFADPFAALQEIAEHEAPGNLDFIEEAGGRDGEEAISDAGGGDAFIDPFTPNFWNEEVRPSNGAAQLAGKYDEDGGEPQIPVPVEKPVEMAVEQAGDPAGPDAELAMNENAEPPMDGVDGEAGMEPPMEMADVEPNPEDQTDPSIETAALDGSGAEELEMKPDPAVESMAAQMQEEIGRELAEALGADSELSRELTVVASDGEVLISLTDNLGISMYEIGSAVPSRNLVLALEKIGAVLAGQKGGIRIRGHTDGRPFSSGDYDNWRLSSARAQSAYYMLLRGGLDETRVREISGLADRELLEPSEPYSPKNRRIEVLIEVVDG
jgi:chemotaxis protein MotB